MLPPPCSDGRPIKETQKGDDDRPADRIAITKQVSGSAGTMPSSAALLDTSFRRQTEVADMPCQTR
ncbi:hypothetical protein CCMA1212_006111 [Trichoderma ghanense]|uniref:Uncharacterized protein n=1 Tax=Trichoderma ghanense TaxID=65468 RepID=A0ABY2H611_9HYPO